MNEQAKEELKLAMETADLQIVSHDELSDIAGGDSCQSGCLPGCLSGGVIG